MFSRARRATVFVLIALAAMPVFCRADDVTIRRILREQQLMPVPTTAMAPKELTTLVS